MNTHSSPQPIPTSRSNNNTTTGSNTSSRDLHSGPSFHLQRQQPLHHHPHHHQHQHQRPPLVKRSHSHGGCLDSDRASTLLGSGGRRPLNLFDDYLEDSPVEEALFASDDEEAHYDHRDSDGGGDGIDSFGRQQQKVRLEENHRQYQPQRQQQRHSLQTYPGHPLHPSQHAPAYMSDESAFMLGSSSPKPRSFLTSMPPHRRSFQGIHAIRKGQQEVEEENEDEEVVVVEEEEEEVVEEQEDRMKKKKSRVGETHANSTKNDVKEEDAEPIVEKQLVEKGRPAQERGALQRNENGQRGGAHATTVVAAAAITVTTPEPLHLLPPSPPPSTTTPTSNATRRVTRESGQQQQQQHQQSLKQGLQQHQHVQQQQQHYHHQQELQQQQQQQQQESHAMSEDRRKSPVTTLSASGTNDSVGNDDSLSCLGGAQTTHAVARGASSEGVVGTAMNMTTTTTASAPSPSLTPTPSLRVNRGTAHLSQHLHPSITIDTSSECLRRPFSGNNTGTTNASTHSIPSTHTHTHTHTHTNTNTTSTTGSNGSISEAFKARETPSTASAADVPTTTTTTATTTASTATTGLNCGSKLNDFSGPQSRPEGHLSMSLLQQKEKGERECQGQGQSQEKERQQQQQQQQQYDHLNVTRPMASAFSSSSPWSTLKNSSLPPAPPISSSSSSLSLQYQQNVLLPSLSPTSPRTANPALVNSLDQLSLSWRAPEQTPSFPINRLHRSRTLSSGGLRPILNGGGGGGTGGNMTMTAMASGGGSGSGSYFPACPTGSTLSSSSSFGPQSNPVPTVSPTTPMVTSSSYSSLPYSPAVAFLSNLVDVTTPALVNPDDEGEAVGDFIMGKVIGHGGFSVVREAFATQVDGLVARVAVKVVKARTDGGKAINGRIHRMLRKEVAIWSRLSHPNVVPFVAVEKLPCATFVFCELCTGGSLLDYLAKRTAGKKTTATAAASSTWGSLSAPTTSTTTGLPEEEARKIFNQIAAAVRYMHVEKQIVHRDIKLENVLQHEDGTWKVCDFGLAECQNEEAANYFFDSPLSPTFGSASSSSPSNSSSSHGSCRSSESSSSHSQASELMLSSSSSSSLSMSSSSATTQHGLLGSRQERSQSLTGLDVVMEDAAGEGQEDECDEAVEDEEQMVGGSLAYCSPEQLRSCVPLKTPSSDVWSLGVVLYALLTGRLPFQDEYEPRLQYQILNGHYDDPTESSREARDLLRKMFHAKPEQRWRIDQVMDSAWCQGTTLEDSNSDVARFSSGGGVGGGMSASAFFGMGSMRF
ncbi:hypothetical protein DFQ26_006143 [Actinomortierella ambigua]|nr:hypothetical protein DFQ26_006143 [Actinomortierella ambigua]